MNKILALLVSLLLALPAAAQVTTSTRFGFRSVTDPSYGAACGTTSDDYDGFADALAAAAAAGGGTVYVPACPPGEYYYFLTSISMPSNVLLKCQEGAVLKQREPGAMTYSTTEGVSLIGFYGVSNSGIEGCTLDSTAVDTATDQANPIVVGSSVPDATTVWSGTRSSHITIENNRVLGQSHSAGPYLMFVQFADDVRIIGNFIDGNQTTNATSDQMGIEIVAANRVEVANNVLQDIGSYGINIQAFGTGSFAGYQNTDINIHDNQITVAKVGIGVRAAEDGADLGGGLGNIAYLSGATVANNVIRSPWETGIRVSVEGTVTALTDMFRNVLINGNVVTMDVLTSNPYGLLLEFTSANGNAEGFTVSNNVFQGGKGAAVTNQTCMRLSFVKNVNITGNHCAGGDTSTAAPVVLIADAATSNVSFVGNYFGQSNSGPVTAYRGDDFVWTGNIFEGWNAVTDAAPAISVVGATNRWVVVGNKFIKDPNNASNEGYLVDGTTSNLVGWTWANNSRSWTPSFNRQADGIWDGTCSTTPGNGPQFGCVTINTGAATATVTNTLVRSGSRVYLNQISGDPIAAKAAAGSGSFVVTLSGNCTTANCTFNYEVMQ